MRKQIFTVLAALGGLVCMHAQVTVSQGQDVKAAIEGASSGDVRIEAGVYKLPAEIEVPAGVTVIGGFVGGFADANRIYPGAAASNAELTILDGNSLETLKADKHRVATVNGTLEGVVVRGGHRRDGNGGGLLVNATGVVANCIIKGNVAMSVISNNALGGGVYLAGGTLVNSVVAYNMANNGYGVAGNGKVVNNTITANTYAPEAVKVDGADYKHYAHHRETAKLPEWPGGVAPLDGTEITVSEFYLSATQTTTSQYAVFTASLDLAWDKTTQLVTLANSTALKDLIDPSSSTAVGVRMGFTDENAAAPLFKEAGTAGYGLQKRGNDYIYYYDANNSSYSNNAMANVTWFGSLAYSLWLGGTLPTEGQWELAARSNGTLILDEFMYAGGPDLGLVSWYSGSGRVQDVAGKQPTSIGFYDMTGNVWEWCADRINNTGTTGSYPVASEYASGNAIDPIYINTSPSSNRVTRGGSWGHADGFMALAFRSYSASANVYSTVGLRPVLVP